MHIKGMMKIFIMIMIIGLAGCMMMAQHPKRCEVWICNGDIWSTGDYTNCNCGGGKND